MKKIMWFFIGLTITPILLLLTFSFIQILTMLAAKFTIFSYIGIFGSVFYLASFIVPIIVAIIKWKKNKFFSIGILTSAILLFLMISTPSFVRHKTVKSTIQK